MAAMGAPKCGAPMSASGPRAARTHRQADSFLVRTSRNPSSPCPSPSSTAAASSMPRFSATPPRVRPWCSCTKAWARWRYGAIFRARLRAGWARRHLSTHVSVTASRTACRASARRGSCTRRRSTCCPALLDRLGIERPLLVGHSDGASIALIHAAPRGARCAGLVCMAPHVFVEPVCVESIAKIRESYSHDRPQTAARQVPRARRRRVPRLGRHLAGARVPGLVDRGPHGPHRRSRCC